MDEEPMKVLVTGATGYIGGRLVPELVERGHEVRVFVRDPTRIKGRPWADQVEVVVGDVEDPATLGPACADVDVAYYLIHLMDSGRGFVDRDRRAAENFVEAARGVGRVVYLGGLVPESGTISPHLASRAEVGEILRRGLPTVEFRAGPVIGSGSASFEMVRYLTERLPAMVAPRWILNPVQPIAVRDIMSYLLLAVDRGHVGVYNVGSDPLTFKGMMQGFADVRGLRRVILPVPVLAPRLAALWVGLVTPIPNRLAVPLIMGIVQPVVGDTAAAKSDFPEVSPLPYREAVRLALERTEAAAVMTRWSGALGSSPSFELTTREGMVRETRHHISHASQDRIFDVVSSLGGDRGWLIWDWAWALRGIMDRMIGGPGLRRGRRHPTELITGDAVDFWRVEAVDPPRLLRLRAEMKLPGKAWLQWETETTSAGTSIVQTALFAPVGLTGTLYWNMLYPVHQIMFSAMVRNIAEEAEKEP
jgi:uncharacterized protein YbjT (DUF2867 family)